MTLHQLRLAVGDDDFFRILRRWAQPAGGRQRHDRRVHALAESISGQQLDELFETGCSPRGDPRSRRRRPPPLGDPLAGRARWEAVLRRGEAAAVRGQEAIPAVSRAARIAFVRRVCPTAR